MFKRKAELKNLVAFALAMFCFAVTAYYLVFGYGAYLDADMSSELALASHLAKEGKLVSDTWLYSTEVRVLSTQLVFAPLMALFPHDWQLVRALGCIILLGMMACSSYYCARKLGSDQYHALIFAGMGVLPLSIVYAQMIVIGAYYVPHAILINLFVAWSAGSCKERGIEVKGLSAVLLGTFMCATSIRYLLCAVIPVAASGMYMMLFPVNAENRSREEKRFFLISMIAAALSMIGYVVGERVLAANFLWNPGEFGGRRLISLTSENLFILMDQALDGLLKLMGFQEHRYLISIQGLLSLGILAVLALAGMLVIRGMSGQRQDTTSRIGLLVMLMSAGMTLATFLFVENMYVNRYWIPVMTLGGPVMALCLTRENNQLFRRLALLVFIGVTVGLSAVNVRNSMTSPEIDRKDMENASAIESLGIDFGYASFWNANVLSELTDGRLEVVSFKLIDENERYPRLNSSWLEVKENTEMKRPEESVFLLLSKPEAKQLELFVEACEADEVQLPNEEQRLFVIKTQRLFFETIEAFSQGTGE